MDLTRPIVRSHHERWGDGACPDSLRDKEIPLLTRILQLVDIYDALVSEWLYKSALSAKKIKSIMIEEVECGWRDAEITAVFLDIFRNRSEDFPLCNSRQGDMSIKMFENIQRTGALVWRG